MKELLKRKITYVYLLTFFTSAHFALVTYINSTVLKNFISESQVGIAYAVGSLVALLCLLKVSGWVKQLGRFKMALLILLADLASMLGLALVSSPLRDTLFSGNTFAVSDGAFAVAELPIAVVLAALSSFLLFNTTIILNRFIIDVYAEEFSAVANVGNIRAILLVSMNVAFVLSPFIVGQLAPNEEFWKVYLLSAAFLLGSITVLISGLRHAKETSAHNPPPWETLAKIWHHRSIRSIIGSNFLLEFFYSWMVIYTPIYLNVNLGFAWSDIGNIFSVMLLPFVIFQLPLGKIADKWLGEKEILVTGYIIMAAATAYLSFITDGTWLTWGLALFGTRIGASFVEVMNEAYFFKKIHTEDTDVIGLFRNMSPIAFIIGPAVGTVALVFIDIKYLFLILGAIMLYGIKLGLSIKDTL